MGLFSGIKDAKVSQGGVYLTAGNYPKLEVLATKVGRTRKNRDFFVAELKVHESDGPEARKPNTRCSWMVMMDNDAALGNVKGFVAALFNCGEDEVDEDAVNTLISDAQPGAGRFVKAEATQIKTKKDEDFTRVRWEAIPEANPA